MKKHYQIFICLSFTMSLFGSYKALLEYNKTVLAPSIQQWFKPEKYRFRYPSFITPIVQKATTSKLEDALKEGIQKALQRSLASIPRSQLLSTIAPSMPQSAYRSQLRSGLTSGMLNLLSQSVLLYGKNWWQLYNK